MKIVLSASPSPHVGSVSDAHLFFVHGAECDGESPGLAARFKCGSMHLQMKNFYTMGIAKVPMSWRIKRTK